ncbi:heparan sulfate 2-O-sulfotransferase pipe isoform X3 [Episyrphus balteatus]|uniref:heparan sulfate 2-O-sulfotransferase pipe isoform X3 n=1 Tax=Episyrphus balteatus TaxID=286459 RepID=UPI002485F588|nr:heparan sulfate 2-O-sulfotransferase pipe isoform X3 [Episyrphus balteatus]
MSVIVDKNCMKMKIRDVENAFRYRRIPYPKRSVELIALIAISCTFFLFMHTKNLNTRLREMEVKLQPSEFSALGLTGEHHISGGGDGSRSGNDINTLHGTYQYLKSTGQIEELNAANLNNTAKAEIDILFFNRVPKVGSQSLMELMKRLTKINGYITVRDKPREMETILVTEGRAYQIADEIMELKEPAAYSKHIAYLNFTQLDFPKPIYINLVRDPIERLASWFYYIRAPWYIADRRKHFPKTVLPAAEWLEKDFATCLRESDPECVFEQNSIKNLGDHRRQMLFFCGQDDSVCLPFNSYHAMQIAKRTVEKEYAVVGSWEDTNITLSVLEKYIPKFFNKALDVYQKSQHLLGKVNKNTSRPPVTQEVRDLLSRNMTHEIEFYQFCKQRLYRQYLAVTLN